LIEASGFRRFPPRLREQPIFYPVCNEAYAIEIAERWNARDDAGGFVTRFAVRRFASGRMTVRTMPTRTSYAEGRTRT
jgi:hypothetical protein